MIKDDSQNDMQFSSGYIIEETRWVVTGVAVSIVLLVIVYFGLTL